MVTLLTGSVNASGALFEPAWKSFWIFVRVAGGDTVCVLFVRGETGWVTPCAGGGVCTLFAACLTRHAFQSGRIFEVVIRASCGLASAIRVEDFVSCCWSYGLIAS